MTPPCHTCGASQLAAIHFPGYDQTEAIICLHCGAVQPAPAPAGSDRPGH